MRNKNTTHTEYNSISYGSKILGDISSDKDIRIDGELEGTITSTGKIILGQRGIIKGKIECESAEISGKVEGEIYTSGVLTLRGTAVVSGNVVTQNLIIDSKAIFNGSCSMNEKNFKLHAEKTESHPLKAAKI